MKSGGALGDLHHQHPQQEHWEVFVWLKGGAAHIQVPGYPKGQWGWCQRSATAKHPQRVLRHQVSGGNCREQEWEMKVGMLFFTAFVCICLIKSFR